MVKTKLSGGVLLREVYFRAATTAAVSCVALLSCASPTTQVLLPPALDTSIASANSEVSTGRPYYSRTFTSSQGVDREYLLRLPAGFEANSCADVIFDFHGAGGSAEKEFNYTSFASLADREGIILVHPDANKEYVDQNHKLASYWNSAWEANLRERDYDVDFVLELVESLKAELCTVSFYATGMSAGGDMVSALACLADSPFKSFAPVTDRYYNTEECADAPPRPTISFQGDADTVVPITGAGDPWFDPPMEEIMHRWAEHNQCDDRPLEQRVGSEVVRYYWENCAAATEWYLIEGGGHTWPGGVLSERGDHVTAQISATEVIWKFFNK